jgi:DNA anti-recombination protein RmuC
MFEKPIIGWKVEGKSDGTITQSIVSSIDLSIFAETQSQEYIDKVMKSEMTAVYEEIESLKSRLQDDKTVLERSVDSLKTELKSLNNAIPRMNSIAEKLEFQKKSAADKELKKREQSLYMDKLRLEQK